MLSSCDTLVELASTASTANTVKCTPMCARADDGAKQAATHAATHAANLTALYGTLQAVTEMEAGSSAVAFHLQGDREMYTEENLTKVDK